MRREFVLPQDDIDWLEGRGKPYELAKEGGVLHVIVHGYPVPEGFNTAEVVASVRIDPGYPDSQIDMVYFFPPLVRNDGRQINATCIENFDGRSWQRWSRHRTPANPWRPGIDNLSTHFSLVADWLSKEKSKAFT